MNSIFADNTTLSSNIAAKCSSDIGPLNDSLASPKPKQTVQYYRASTLSLTLDGALEADGMPDTLSKLFEFYYRSSSSASRIRRFAIMDHITHVKLMTAMFEAAPILNILKVCGFIVLITSLFCFSVRLIIVPQLLRPMLYAPRL